MRRRHVPLLVIMLLLPALVATAPPAAAIYAGTTPSTAGDFPGMALVLREESAGVTVLCGGVLIAATKVVTAAHCVTEGVDYVSLGHNAMDAVEIRAVAGVAVHPDFAFNPERYERDVAVLTLAAAADTTPATLATPSQSSLWSATNPASIAGWGATASGEPSQNLLSAQLSIISDDGDEGCNGGDTLGCAAGAEAAACSGDEGGPVFVDDTGGSPVLVGVMTLMYTPECDAADRVYFVRVGQEPISSWVRSQYDTLGPRVSSAAPTGTTVDRDRNLMASFSEWMRTESLNSSTFRLFRRRSDGSWTRVENVVVLARNDVPGAVLNPFGGSTGRLAARTRYKAVVTPGARDAAGNRLDQNRSVAGNQSKVWYFKTGWN